MQTSSLLLLIVAMVLTMELGLAGLILAPGATVAVQVLWTHLVEPQRKPAAAPVVTVDALEASLGQLRANLEQVVEPPAPEVFSLVKRTESLVATSKEM
jgi:predicted PurR-regulated permease PerM